MTRRYITNEELQKHVTPTDLWISIQGKVYDVTQWSKIHPGGELPLLQLAGQDATDPFLAYHPGTVWHLLDPFYVGHLHDYSVSDVSRDYRRLVSEFSKLGMFEQRGNTVTILLMVIAVLFSAVVYSVLCVESAALRVASGFLLGILWIQSGWIGHDSGHHNVMPSKGLTRFTQVLCGNCFAGICIAWWKRNHNAHHIACNSLEYDPDLQFIPLFAVHSRLFNSIRSYFYDRKLEFTRIARFMVSYQHWTFYPVMAVARINLFAQSLILLFTHKSVPNRLQEILGMAVFYIWYPLLVSFLPTWPERVAFVLASLSGVGIQHVQFCLNHFSSSVFEGPPKGLEWVKMQTAGTLNVDCSPWMDWFHGGLQFQVEHHLFPRLPRCHYRKIAPLVRDFCKRNGLVYSSASFWQSNLMIVRTLRNAAMEARDLTSPIPKNLVWEAMNAHG